MRIPESVENICLADAYIEENTLYAAGFEQNIFFEWDLNSSQLKWARKFEGFQYSMSTDNLAILKYKDRLFYFSKNSYEIAEYNLKNHEIYYYYPEKNIEKPELVRLICRIRDEVWLFGPPLCRSAVTFSLEKRIYSQNEFPIIGREAIETPVSISIENNICIDDKIWRCIAGTSSLLIFDTINKTAYIKKTDLTIPFYTMNFCEGLLYILAMDGKHIAVLNPYTYESYIYQTGYLRGLDRPFREVIKIDKYIFLLPCFEQAIWCCEVGKEEISLVKLLKFPKGFKRIHDIEHRSMFLRWKRVGDNLYLLPFAGNAMLSIDLNSLEITCYPIKITEGYYLAQMLQDYSIENRKQFMLEDYLKAISYDRKSNFINPKEKSHRIGSIVWDELQSKD